MKENKTTKKFLQQKAQRNTCYDIPAERGSIKYAQVLRTKMLFVFNIGVLYFLHLKFLIFHPKK